MLETDLAAIVTAAGTASVSDILRRNRLQWTDLWTVNPTLAQTLYAIERNRLLAQSPTIQHRQRARYAKSAHDAYHRLVAMTGAASA